MMDANEIDQIIDRNREIQSSQNEVNENLRRMGEEDFEQEVSQMLEELTRETEKGKNR